MHRAWKLSFQIVLGLGLVTLTTKVFEIYRPAFFYIPTKTVELSSTTIIFVEIAALVALFTLILNAATTLHKDKREQELKVIDFILGALALSGFSGLLQLFLPALSAWVLCNIAGSCAPLSDALKKPSEFAQQGVYWSWISMALALFVLDVAVIGLMLWRNMWPPQPRRGSILEPTFFSLLQISSLNDPSLVIGASHEEWFEFGTGNARQANKRLLWTKLGSPLALNESHGKSSALHTQQYSDDLMNQYVDDHDDFDQKFLIKLYRKYCLKGEPKTFLRQQLASRVHRWYGMSRADCTFSDVVCSRVEKTRWWKFRRTSRDKTRVLFMRSAKEVEDYCNALKGNTENYFGTIRARAFKQATEGNGGRLFWACQPLVLSHLQSDAASSGVGLENFKEWNFALAERKSADAAPDQGVVYFSPHPLSVSGVQGRFPVTVYPAAFQQSYDPSTQSIDTLEDVNSKIRSQIVLLRLIQEHLPPNTTHMLYRDIHKLHHRCKNCTANLCAHKPVS